MQPARDPVSEQHAEQARAQQPAQEPVGERMRPGRVGRAVRHAIGRAGKGRRRAAIARGRSRHDRLLHRRGAVGRGRRRGGGAIGARSPAAHRQAAARTRVGALRQAQQRQRGQRGAQQQDRRATGAGRTGGRGRCAHGSVHPVSLGQEPAIIRSSIRIVGALMPRRNTRSSARTMRANMSFRLPAMVNSATGSASVPPRIMKPEAPRL